LAPTLIGVVEQQKPFFAALGPAVSAPHQPGRTGPEE